RAKKVAEQFDEIQSSRKNREFHSFTGSVKGYGNDNLPLTVISTGIGNDNIEICLIELSRITKNPVVIRIGSCGGLQDFIGVGDLVVSTGSVRLENTSLFFVESGYPAVAHHEIVLAMITACQRLGTRYHAGLTAAGSGFYGAQGRKIEKFPLRYPELPNLLRERNVLNFEMESSTLFTLAQLWGIRAGTVCAVYANRFTDEFISPEQKVTAERTCINAGIETAKILQWMDMQKGTEKYWIPELTL
ncbi:MAG: nucleoside phosphorylase, partial [Candidatus Hodarchaeales archaeon]